MSSGSEVSASPGSPLADFAEVLGRNSPEEAMRLSCERLLRQTRQSQQVPVALEPLLGAVGARQEELPLSTAARLRVDEHGYLVGVRAGGDWRRRRFSIAHEIGHILLCEALKDRPDQLRALREPCHWPAVERLCNRAAAELLMPSADFVAEAGAERIDPALLRRLRERYGVSWTALAIRFQQLMGFGVSAWTRHRRHEEERVALRVAGSWGRGICWLPVGLTSRYLDPDVIEIAAREGQANAEGELRLGGRSTRVNATAVSLRATEARLATEPLEEIDPPDAPPAPDKILLFLRPSNAGPPGGPPLGAPADAEQLVLVG